jgi:hypothetical protein
MTNKPKRDSRHITLKPEALLIYDQWKADGEASKVSDAIVEKHNKSTGEVFTPEQQEWIKKTIASFLSGH